MKIIPIIWPEINWFDFVNESNLVLGRSPTRTLDNNNIPVGDLPSFVMAVGGFIYENFDPYHYFNDFLLEHLSFSFLCITDTILRLTERNIIFSYANSSVFLMTGNLFAFKCAILEQCQEYTDREIRFFYNYLYLLFCSKGLSKIWNDYKVRKLEDGTLELRKI